MSGVERWNCLFHGVDRVLVGLTGILLLSLALWIYGLQVGGVADVALRLLALVIASWIGVGVVAGAALVPIWVFVRARGTCR